MKTRNRAGRMGWRATLALAAASLHAPALPAQCIPTWNTHHVAAGVIGTVNRARMWNGRLMLAGKFEVVGNRIVSNVASWDPATGTFAPKRINFLGVRITERLVDLAAAFERCRVNQDRARLFQTLLVIVVVAEELQSALGDGLLVVFVGLGVAGDIVAQHLRVRRVVADDNEDRWDTDAVLLPEAKGLFVMSIERV